MKNTAEKLPRQDGEPNPNDLGITPENIQHSIELTPDNSTNEEIGEIELPDERPKTKDEGLERANAGLDKIVELNQETRRIEEEAKKITNTVKEKITQAVVDAETDTEKIKKQLARIYQETARENKNLTEDDIEEVIKQQINIAPLLVADEDIANLWQDAFKEVFND